MVFVDFGNKWLRTYLPVWLKKHEKRFEKVSKILDQYAVMAAEDGKPLAAVIDIDEVILSNIHQNEDPETGFKASDHFYYPEGVMVDGRSPHFDPILPGAEKFLKLLKYFYRCEIFLVTGRYEVLRAETVENFVKLGLCSPKGLGSRVGKGSNYEIFTYEQLMSPSGPLRMRPPGNNKPLRLFKEPCRAEISKKYTILINVGDQASDLGQYGLLQFWMPHPFYSTY